MTLDRSIGRLMLRLLNFETVVIACEWIVTALALLGVDVPVFRQAIGFLFVTLVPGLVFLRVAKRREPVSTRVLLYAVGLSVAFVMFVGLAMNLTHTLIGTSKPLSLIPLVAVVSAVILPLHVIACHREKQDRRVTRACLSYAFSPFLLAFTLLPALAALGISLVNNGQSNLLLLVVLAIIGALAVASGRVPPAIYPIAVGAIALSLMWHFSLAGQSLTGADTHAEYYYANAVVHTGFWDPAGSQAYSATLSVAMLAPVYSILMNLDVTWVLKIVYSILFALVPVALFQVYRRRFSDSVSFLAAFFLVSFATFANMAEVPREEIAELFFALSVLLIVDTDINPRLRAFMMVAFAAALVVSHYSTSYVYIILFLLAAGVMIMLRWYARRGSSPRSDVNRAPGRGQSGPDDRFAWLSPPYIMLLIVVALSWYMFIAGGTGFSGVVNVARNIYQGVVHEFFDPSSREDVVMLAFGRAPTGIVYSMPQRFLIYVQYAIQVFIVVGWVMVVLDAKKKLVDAAHSLFVCFATASLVLMGLVVVLPYLSSATHTDRFYHLACFFLAPLCIVGGMRVIGLAVRAIPGFPWRGSTERILSGTLAAIILVPYLLLSTGFVAQVAGESASSLPLNPEGRDYAVFTRMEVSAKDWLVREAPFFREVYGDYVGNLFLMQNYGPYGTIELPLDAMYAAPDSFIFLRRWNVVHGERQALRHVKAQDITTAISPADDTSFSELLLTRNLIYDNGSARVYR